MASFCPSCGAELTPGARFCASCGAPAAQTCGACGGELVPGAAFCPSCGAAQAASDDRDTAPEELRVVSCLFADLAGFTSHTERSDPEQVRARLAVYHARVREDVGRWDGSVEKLMGDGVFAVFGVPTIHEDDPERAVRAALRIQQSVSELNAAQPDLDLSVRIGVTTGEAIIQLDARDQSERIIGDVVNTASRLEGVAPTGGVIVDERTYRAVRNTIRCEPMDPVEVKGKAAPIMVWRAVEAKSRYGVAVAEEETTALVGRQEELSLLKDALERTVARRSVQLVTISGEPGVGKSRLVREFWGSVDRRSDLVVRWRQGRSLPYGEGVTFWALSEIVKSEAGILDSEPPEVAAEKLAASVASLVMEDDVDVEWLISRMAPLVGTGGAEGIEQTEMFSAWLQYLELLAARTPLVMVIEDLHWADGSLADFLEYVLDWCHDAPVLLVCTARPEWFTRRPSWGGGNREGATIALEPLTSDDTAKLVASLTGRSVMDAASQSALLERSGGNPLYLIEYLRLAEEQELDLDASSDAEIPLPDSVQAIIAARLDLLDADDRALIQAAAVVGRIFWTGALTFLREGETDATRAALQRLVRRGLLRPVRRSSMQGQEEFAFTHVLARDVAYGQLTRSEKARLHRETARWMEAVSGGRAIDVAELLAHHLVTALSLQPSDDREQRARAYRYLMLAAERGKSLDAAAAARYASQAAELAPGPLERASALMLEGETPTGTREHVLEVLTEAIELLEGTEADLSRALALKHRSRMLWWAGDRDGADADLEAALTLVEEGPTSVEKAEVLAAMAGHQQLAGRDELALDYAERALAAAAEVGDVRVRAGALRIRGMALVALGSLDGMEQMEEAQQILLDRGDTAAAMSGYNGLATMLGDLGQAREAVALIDEAIAYGEQRGAMGHVEWSMMTKCESSMRLGRVEEVDELADRVIAADDARGGSQSGIGGRYWKAYVHRVRGEYDEAHAIVSSLLPAAHDVGDPQILIPLVAEAIVASAAVGSSTDLPALLEEFVDLGRANPGYVPMHLPVAARELVAAGMLDEVLALTDSVPISTPWLDGSMDAVRALVDEARGDPATALGRLLPAIELADERGLVQAAVQMRVDAARCAASTGNDSLAGTIADEARRDATRCGFLAEIDRLDGIREEHAAG